MSIYPSSVVALECFVNTDNDCETMNDHEITTLILHNVAFDAVTATLLIRVPVIEPCLK